MTAVEYLYSFLPTMVQRDLEQKYQQAKEMEKAATISKKEIVEISDEEIEKAKEYHWSYRNGFVEGAKWYREQLRQRK